MKKFTVITGGGSGIGRALAHVFAAQKQNVLIVGRRADKLIETQKAFPGFIESVPADISSAEGRQAVFEKLQGNSVSFLVHNAAVLGKIQPVLEFNEAEWQEVLDTNLSAPLFLSAKLLPLMQKGRILHISSGAAHYALKSWGAYCVSKAALLMLYQMLREELQGTGVQVGSLRPGIVNTEMQGHIREADLERFPHLARFHDFHRQQQLEAPETVAQFIHWVLTKSTDKQYSAKEWDIREDMNREE